MRKLQLSTNKLSNQSPSQCFYYIDKKTLGVLNGERRIHKSKFQDLDFRGSLLPLKRAQVVNKLIFVGGHIKQSLGFTLGSVHMDYSWRCSGHHIWYHELNLSGLTKWKAVYSCNFSLTLQSITPELSWPYYCNFKINLTY